MRNLTQHAAQDVWSQWSPDGKKIIFRSDREGTPAFYVMNRDGSNLKPLGLE